MIKKLFLLLFIAGVCLGSVITNCGTFNLFDKKVKSGIIYFITGIVITAIFSFCLFGISGKNIFERKSYQISIKYADNILYIENVAFIPKQLNLYKIVYINRNNEIKYLNNNLTTVNMKQITKRKRRNYKNNSKFI